MTMTMAEGNVYGDWEGSDARIAWRSSSRSRDPLETRGAVRGSSLRQEAKRGKIWEMPTFPHHRHHHSHLAQTS